MQGKVIALTGAFGVLGRAVGQALVDQGARLVLIDRAETPSPELSAAHDGSLVLGGVDLTAPAQAAAAIARILDRFGRLDGLVNVAGGFRWERLAEGSIDTWDYLYSINLKTAVVACQAALPALAAAGKARIVNIGSGAAVKAGAGMGAYAASKAGVAKLTEALAEETRDKGITVNAILPTIIDTPQNRRDMPEADATRWVTPQAIADLVLFMLSDRATEITGALVPISNRS